MKENEKLNDLLDQHHLKKTAARLSVLSILSARKVATSQPDLEQMIGKDVDRVTLYRVLNTFEKSGIIHKVLDLNGTSNYALCTSSCTPEHHLDEHVHFNCTQCENIYCLEHVVIPELAIPEGFTANSKNLILYGTCATCNEK